MKDLILGKDVYNQMLQHVIACLPNEACGLVGGLDNNCSVVVPIVNWIQSPTRFRMDPRQLIWGLQSLENQHLDLMAIYHSHPLGMTTPSSSDMTEFLYPEAVMLIWAACGMGWLLNGFEFERGKFSYKPLTVVSERN